ncbi:MAG: hypothetical protein HY660_15570 [Armatimonadetes bacterium]|nr:hypothetical protein [Armatimonadota bacterium]
MRTTILRALIAILIVMSVAPGPTQAVPPEPSPLTLFPRGTLILFRARADLDGRPPHEVILVGQVPAFPGAPQDVLHGVIAAVAPVGGPGRAPAWTLVYREQLAGRGFLPPLIGPLAGGAQSSRSRVVVFPSLAWPGPRLAYDVVGFDGRRAVVLLRRQGIAGAVVLVDRKVVERGAVGALAWTMEDRRMVPTPFRGTLPETLPRAYWRYAARRGVVAADRRVRVAVGQILYLVREGGGGIPVIAPDRRLDLVEEGYRAREPGTYTITIHPVSGGGSPFVLTVDVADPGAQAR